MRRLFFVFLVSILAVPALAQNNPCRGKAAFKLSDGASGCLLEISTGRIRTTMSRTDNDFSRSNTQSRPQLNILMTGEQDTSRPGIVRRARAICTALQPELQKAGLLGTAPNAMIMIMFWPNEEQKAHGATMTKTCGSVRFLRIS